MTRYVRRAQRELLRELTLGLLADLPDEQIRTTLRRWVDADSDDVDAQIALLATNRSPATRGQTPIALPYWLLSRPSWRSTPITWGRARPW